ncbi:MAG: N-methyl-D-aspartate receptor NMDAR2C subunit [Verrucomicrobiota bacterium]
MENSVLAVWEKLSTSRGWHSPLAQVHFEKLQNHYSEPGRSYHNWDHITDCLEQLRESPFQSDAVTTALLFHDAIYDTNRHDNEEASADLAYESLLELGDSPSFANQVRSLVIITDHQTPTTALEDQIITDIDLSILGRSAEVYLHYAQSVRQEYAHISDCEFIAGRRKVMNHFLARQHIFQTGHFHDKFEQAARRNIAHELSVLDERN